MNTTVDIPVVIVMADNRSLSRSLVRSGSELLDDSMRNRPRRSSSTAVRPKSVFQSPKPHKTGFEFDSPPPMPHHIPPAPPVTSEAFVKVFAMLCQHPDKRQQDSMLSAGSETSVVMRTSYADNTVYPFTKVFKPPHPCDDVFQPLLPVVLDCINGINGAIVAYGQRGLDKPVLEGSVTDPGIIPRALNELFALRRRLGLAMSCCIFEVCGDEIHDLVTPAALAAAEIREDSVRVSTLERQEVKEVLLHQRHQSFALLHHAMRLRKANARGHFVTVVRVERPNQSKRGLLYLVDLSGLSDACDVDSVSEKSVFKDSLHTNSDVLHFERMVMSRANGESFIPSKSCLLTRVLIDACGGNSKTALLVFLSPRLEDKKITMHAMQFAQSARSIRNRMRPNTLSTLDLTSLRTAFSILASPSPLGGRRADDSSVFVPSEGDDPRFSQWMQLKPSSNSANVLRALAHGGSPDKSAGLVDSVTDGGPGSPFLSAYSPVSGAASAVVEDSRKGLEKEVSLLSRLLEEEKLQSRKAGDRIEQLQFEKQEAVAQSKNLQRLLKESLEQLDSRRMALDEHSSASSTLLAQVADLQAKVSKADDDKAEVERSLVTLREAYERELANASGKVSELKSTVESLRAQCAAAQTATVSAKAAQEELQGRLEDAAREVQRERDASHAVIIAERSHSSKLQQLQHRLDDASEQLLAAEATKLADQKALLAERSKRAAAEEASQRLSDELDLLKSQAKSYSSQLADQQAILADVRRRHKDELAAVNRHLDAEREHARNCEDQLNAAAQDATLHAQQVKRLSSELEDAKSVSQQLEQRLLQSKAELEKNAKRFLVVDKQKSEADGHIGALSDRVRVAEAAADAARAEVQALNGKLRSSSNTAQALRTELDALKQTSSASAKGRTELETELSKCWASRTVAEARVSDLTADVEDKRARIVSLEASVADLQKMVDFQAATIEKLKKDGEFNNENAALFKSEQERCLALMAELHGLQAQASADADALALARQELASLSSSEQRKVVSLKSALNAMKSELDAQLTSTAQLKNECADLQQQLSAARSLAATQVDSLKQDVHQWRLAGQAVVKNVQNCIADLESSTGFDLKRARAMMPGDVDDPASLIAAASQIVTQIEGISGGIEALHSAHTAAAAELGVIRGTVSELRSKVSSDGKVKLDLEMRVSAAESVCANAHRYLLRALSSLQNPLQSLPKSSSWDDAQSSEAESVASLEDLARQTQLAVSKAILCWQSKAEELSDGSAATSGVNNTLTSLKEQLQAATSERNNAVFELERVQLRVSALEDSNQEIESQLGRANRCVDDIRREARELNATIRMLKTNLSALEAEKESLQRQIQSFESIVAQLQAKLVESDKGKPPRPKASGGRDRSELDAMRDHIQKCEATIRDLESQLQRADDDFTRIEVSVREGERVRKDAIARANALETVLAEASAELEAEQQRAADLSGQLSDSQLSCESLQRKCDSLNDELLRVKAQFSAGDVDRTIRDLHDQLAKQSKQSAALQSEMGTALIRLRECDPDRVPSTSHLVPTVVDAVVSLARDLRSDISREAARAQDSSRREAKLQSVYKDTAAKLEAALLDKAQSAREMDDLMSSLSTAEATLRSLRSAVDVEGHSALIAHANKRADDAEKALKELQLQHDSLQHSFAEERTSFAASESSVQQLRDRLQQVHDELDSAGSRCASLEAQLASARHSVDVANSENDRLRDSYRSKASDSNAAQALCDAATAKCHYLTEQLERKDETLAKQRKVTAELESRVASLTLSLRSAEDAKGIAEGNAKSLSTELAIASSRNGTLHGEVEMLRDQIKETTSVLHASGEERSLLQRKVSELQSSLQSSDMVVDALKSGERRLAAELEVARSNLLEATEKLGVSQLQCQQLTSKVAEAERQLKTDARQRDAGDGLVSEWKSKLDSAMAEAKKRNATITELSDKLSRAIAERDGLEIQSRFAQSLSKQLEAQVEELRQSLSSGEEERMAAIEKVKHLEQSLEDADDRLAAATRRIEMLCAEKDASANRASDAVQQRTSLIDRLKQLEAEKAELSVLCANGQQGMQATLELFEQTRAVLERERSDLRQKLQAQEAECADARNAVSDARAALESERHTSAQLRQELQTVKQQLSMSRSDLEANSNRVADIVQQFGSLDSVRRGMADAEVQLQHHKQVIKDLTTRLEAALSGRAAAEARVAALTAALAPAQSPSSLAGEMEVSPELFEDQRATAEATWQLLVEAQADLEATVRALSNAQAQVDAEKRKAASALEAHQEEVRTLQGICAMAQKETSDIRNRHEQAMHQLREAHARVHQLTQECSRLTDWNNSLKSRQQQHSRGGVASGSSPSPLGMMEPEAVRPKPATGPVTGFRLPRTKDAVFPVTEAEDALCAHTKRKHSCEACAIGASVTNLSFGIIPPELVPVVKESPLSAWKANLHGPITASSGALTRPPSVGKPRSAPNSPFSTRVGSTTPARPGDNMVDESFRSSATGILGIEMIAPSPTDTNTSFVQWSLNGLK